MIRGSNSTRQSIALLSLIVVGFFIVYGAVLVAEAISVTPPVLFLGNEAGLPGTLLRIAILSITAVPVAFLTGYALRRWVPALSRQIILAVAGLWILSIVLLQVYVYAPSVLGSSILKILLVVIPLMLAGYRNQPKTLA